MQLIEEVERVLIQSGLRKVVFQEGQLWIQFNHGSVHQHVDGILYVGEESNTIVRLCKVSSETPKLIVDHPITGIVCSGMYGEFRWSDKKKARVLKHREKFLHRLKKHLGWSDSNKLR